MKIQNVEITRSEDGTNSTGDSTSELLLDTPMGDHELEQSLKSLTVALTEVSGELREKTTECEALLATVSALSCALKESDQRCEEKALECEKLKLKLSMVTFLERGEVSSDPLGLLRESTAADTKASLESKQEGQKKKGSESKKAVTKGKSVRPKKPSSSDEKVEKNTIVAIETSSNSVAVDNLPAIENENTDDESQVGEGPRQAHFYKVIGERDQALSTVKKLTKELKQTKAKVRDLKARVQKSTALVEISYDDETKEDCSSNMVVKATSTERPKGMSWLRKNGRSARKDKSGGNPEEETFVGLVTHEEMLPERWNSKANKSEEDYLSAIAASDADRAGGFNKGGHAEVESIRFQV